MPQTPWGLSCPAVTRWPASPQLPSPMALDQDNRNVFGRKSLDSSRPGSWELREPLATCKGMAEAVSGCTLRALLGPWDRLRSGRSRSQGRGCSCELFQRCCVGLPSLRDNQPWPTVLSVNVGQVIVRPGLSILVCEMGFITVSTPEDCGKDQME